MHSAPDCSTTPLQQPVDWVDFRPGSSLVSLSKAADNHNSLDPESSSSLTDNAHPAWPFAIRGAMQEGWPAAGWTPRELLERCGDRTVPLEVASGGGDYRDAYDDARSRPGRTFDAGVPAPLSLLLDAMRSTQEQAPDQASNQMLLYLAQQDVAEVLPELAADIPEAPPFPGLAKRLHQRSVWLGCAGTQTPLHNDPYHNLFCQVWGSKTIRLYDPEQTQSLYPFANPFLRNTSQVDVLSPELDRHPKFASVPYLECTLRPGEMLYIPRKWWHFVWARTPSLSISYWWTATC